MVDEFTKNLILNELKTKRKIDIIKEFHISYQELKEIIKESGIIFKKSRLNMSKLKIDVDYFKEIDNPKKAYWLGYICADGCIQKGNGKFL